VNADPLIEAAGLVADGTDPDWGSVSSRLSSDEERALAGELAIVSKIAQEHRRLHQLLPPTAEDGTPMAPDRSSWGHLELVEIIGRGSYGTVYRAWDSRLDRHVALKLFHGAPHPDAVIREGRMLARIRHDNVVAVYGADVIDGVAGIWMELVRGKNLDQIVKEQGPLSAQEATLVGLGVARALAAVHGAGLLHCDLKGQNVVREAGGRLVLMDLGAGRTLPGTGDTTAVGLTGTPRYMAPEIFEGRPASPQSDLYGVGVLLFYLVTGKFPVDGKTLDEIRQAHADGRRQHLRDLRPDLPPGYVREVAKAIDRDPLKRHTSAGELEAGLLALTPAGPDRIERVGMKKRVLAAAVLAAIVTSLAVIAWPFLQSRISFARSAARSIAVLPIRNLTGDASKNYLADGLTEVLISNLARVKALSVPSFGAVAPYRDHTTPPGAAVDALGVELLLAGSILEAAGRVRLDVQLVDRDGRVTWSKELTHPLSEILAAQGEIARLVAAHLAIDLSSAEQQSLTQRAIDSQAQDAYLKGLVAASYVDAQLPDAVRNFRTATELEPSFAPAWAGWAMTELRLAEFADPKTRLDRVTHAKELAGHALRLDPSEPSALHALGTAQFYYDWNFDGAERSLRQALESSPSSAPVLEELGRLLAARGRLEDAVGIGEQAVRLEPLVAMRLISLGMLHYYNRDYGRAIELMQRSLTVAPEHPVAHFGLGRIHAAMGQYDAAANEIREALSRSRNMAWLPELACVLAAVGQKSGVESVLKELAERERQGEHYSLDHRAHIAAAEGRLDEGLGVLREAVERRAPSVLWMAVDPRLDPFRGDPRFEQLLRDANLR